jgi:beta-lactamase class C
MIEKMLRPVALAIIACCALPSAPRADDSAAKIAAAVDRAFRPLLAEHNVPGMAVGVTVAGERHVFVYGVASKETQAPVTKDTLFELGSVSKTFTATLATYAQAQGKLSLDAHPAKHMPALQDSAVNDATLLHLGTYTAGGLPLQAPEGVNNNADMVAYLKQWKPSAAPGAQRRYSNPSIGLFGHIAGVAMNRDFTELVEAELLPKFGLRRSYLRVPKAEMDSYAWGYNKEDKPTRVSPGVFDAEAYGIKSSIADMLQYVEANIQPEKLEPPLERSVKATHVGYFKVGEMVQGLGWEQYPYPAPLDKLLAGNASTMALEPHPATQLTPPQSSSGPTLFNKTGSTNGFGAYVVFVPTRKIGIVMLANKNFPNAARIKAAYAVLETASADKP